jgi:cobalamin biosynthesis Mg chelatase CobN
MTRRTLPILLVLAATLLWVSPASADRALNVRILNDYVNSGGRLSACKFTIDELKSAKNAIPEDLQQYGASLIAALDDAIAARAQGACNTKKQAQAQSGGSAATPGAAAPPPPPAGSSSAQSSHANAPAPTPGKAQAPPTPIADPAPVASVAADDSIPIASQTRRVATDAPVPVLALAVLAALLALTALLFGVVRFFAWEPAWAVRMRHAAGEAGWRASSTFSEFADFVRLGR